MRIVMLTIALLGIGVPAIACCESQTPAASDTREKTPGEAEGPHRAGVVVLVAGDVQLGRQGGAPHPATIGEGVDEGDRVITGVDGEVHLNMSDGGFIAVRPNTNLTIQSYAADGDAQDHAIFSLLAGGFRSITGWIGRFNANAYRIRTPVATIGVRGTDHEPRYIPEGSPDGEPGAYDRVYAGETFLETAAGTTQVAVNRAAFASARHGERPRLLAGIPVFFKPGPHEAEIAKKHEEIQRGILQRRDERRREIAAKRQALHAERAGTRELARRNRKEAAAESAALPARIAELKRRRAALQQEAQALKAAREALRNERATLQQDVQAGSVAADDVRRRRRALREQSDRLQASRRELEAKQKALAADADALVEERYEAGKARLDAMHDQQRNVRALRDEIQKDQEANREESQRLLKQENGRFRDELKADRDSSTTNDPNREK